MRKSICIIAFAVFFGSLLFYYGDIFDVLNYLLFVSFLALWGRRITRSLGLVPDQTPWLLFVVCHVVLLSSVNRVTGYPDGEIAGELAVLLWLLLSVVIANLLIGRHRPLKYLLVLLFILYLPILELPGFIARQIACELTVIDSRCESELLYYSKITSRYVYGVGLVDDGSTYATFVFERRNGSYTLSTDYWFLDGRGTMDRQYPGLNRFLLYFVHWIH